MNTNSFSMGAQIGGPNLPKTVLDGQQQLRNALNAWVGEYTPKVKEFAFLLRVDGSIHAYTQMWKIRGAQGAKLKKGWIEVEIGVPEDWWREHQGTYHKTHLADAIEKGLYSMIDVLRKKKCEIRAEALLADWATIKADYLMDRRESVM
jgi:hypothetical protein